MLLGRRRGRPALLVDMPPALGNDSREAIPVLPGIPARVLLVERRDVEPNWRKSTRSPSDTRGSHRWVETQGGSQRKRPGEAQMLTGSGPLARGRMCASWVRPVYVMGGGASTPHVRAPQRLRTCTAHRRRCAKWRRAAKWAGARSAGLVASCSNGERFLSPTRSRAAAVFIPPIHVPLDATKVRWNLAVERSLSPVFVRFTRPLQVQMVLGDHSSCQGHDGRSAADEPCARHDASVGVRRSVPGHANRGNGRRVTKRLRTCASIARARHSNRMTISSAAWRPIHGVD